MKLVTIITPTIPERRCQLERCRQSVLAQTYSAIEHLIIQDGGRWSLSSSTILGRNWRQFTCGASYGAIPRRVGTYLAHGDYIGYLDDDDEFLPEHVSKLVALLESTGADFVFSQFKRFWSDGRPPDVIGDIRDGIQFGRIGTPLVLHRAECLRVRNWECDGYREDFELFKAWAKAGLKYAHLPEITVHVYK